MATQGGLESVENQGRSGQEGSKTLGENLTWGTLKDELITFISWLKLDESYMWSNGNPRQSRISWK